MTRPATPSRRTGPTTMLETASSNPETLSGSQPGAAGTAVRVSSGGASPSTPAESSPRRAQLRTRAPDPPPPRCGTSERSDRHPQAPGGAPAISATPEGSAGGRARPSRPARSVEAAASPAAGSGVKVAASVSSVAGADMATWVPASLPSPPMRSRAGGARRRRRGRPRLRRARRGGTSAAGDRGADGLGLEPDGAAHLCAEAGGLDGGEVDPRGVGQVRQRSSLGFEVGGALGRRRLRRTRRRVHHR